MTDFLSQRLTGFALCWRVERRDGVALGFTAHDRDLMVDGFCYRAAPGIAPSAIEQGAALAADTLDVAGALTASAISEADLRAGRWHGAAVRLYAVDWADPGQYMQIARGELGAVSLERGRFSAELKGPAAALDRPVSETTSPACRADLGDTRCRVDMAGRRQTARFISISDDVLTLDGADLAGSVRGRLRWIDGANGGLSGTIVAADGTTVTLAEPPPFVPAAGDRVEIAQGCDRRFATCRDRFGNAANFQGEPHLPGVDLLTRYPGE